MKSEPQFTMESGQEASSWAKGIASRLWMLQTSFADDKPAIRHDYLRDEIERAMKSIPNNQRAEYLRALLERFPGPERIILTGTAPAPTPVAEKTGLQLGDELLRKIPEMSLEQRSALAQKFQAFGLIPIEKSSFDIAPALRGKLGMSADEPIDSERASKLFGALLEMVSTLDHLIWNLWKNIAPKSIIRRDPDMSNLRRTVGRYLAGDREVATLQISQMLEKTRQLVVGILSAMGPAGGTYAQQHLEKFAPEKIRAIVESKSPGFLGNVEQKCWRRYTELATELNGPAVEKQLIDAIVSYTETLVASPDLRGR
jgi:hypothetical protein